MPMTCAPSHLPRANSASLMLWWWGQSSNVKKTVVMMFLATHNCTRRACPCIYHQGPAGLTQVSENQVPCLVFAGMVRGTLMSHVTGTKVGRPSNSVLQSSPVPGSR
jgi:hypothetical protein